ncbi:hypothetical protein [Acinetobacter rudis]|uniref:hypothetical protein n=1 Tax=Acinetobacter rudis TaxID=632955 RepID=UPI003341C12C
MLKYLVLNNIEGCVSKNYYLRSKEGEFIGDIPGWVMLFDPKYINNQLNVRNRVKPNNFVLSKNKFNIKVVGDSALISSTEMFKSSFQPNLNFKGEEWSAFFVCSPLSISGVVPHGVFRSIKRGENGTQVGINISFLTNGQAIRIYKNGSTNPGGSAGAILTAEIPPGKINNLACYMVTFSTDLGFKVYCDNELIKESNYKIAANFGINIGEWEIYPDFAGDIGLTGLLNVDLSSNDNMQARQKIFSLVKERYQLV